MYGMSKLTSAQFLGFRLLFKIFRNQRLYAKIIEAGACSFYHDDSFAPWWKPENVEALRQLPFVLMLATPQIFLPALMETESQYADAKMAIMGLVQHPKSLYPRAFEETLQAIFGGNINENWHFYTL
jgi:hypothetical protein